MFIEVDESMERPAGSSKNCTNTLESADPATNFARWHSLSVAGSKNQCV